MTVLDLPRPTEPAREARSELPASRTGSLALAVTVAAWVGVLAQILRHRIYVSHDTVINYAHTWWLAERGPSLRMPVLGHGEAFTFPYGLVPWSIGAALRPLLGDRAVTLTLVAAIVGLIAATFWAFPELRRGWWATAVLVEPALVTGALIGQLPFLAGSALLLAATGAWRRGHVAVAVVTAGLAQATHPAIVLPLALLLVAGRLPWEPRRRRLATAYALSLLIALPATWITLHVPVVQETSPWVKAFGFVATLAPRSLVLVVPVALVLLRRYLPDVWRARSTGPAVVIALLVANAGMWVPLGMPWAWGALTREPDTRMVEFTHGSGAFEPGATYRLLRVADGKIGMYQLLQGGGRLDSEFFPESIDRRSWPTTAEYARFLDRRRVDFVMIWDGYDQRFGTNEHALLEEMLTTPPAGTTVTRVERTGDYDLFAVDRSVVHH